MLKDFRATPSGLNTAPASGVAPTGALLEALNVSIRRPGLAEPRPGFKENTAIDAFLASTERIYHFDGKFLGLLASAAGMQWEGSSVNPAAAIDPIYCDVADMRQNLYIPATTGLRKFTGANTLSAEAGLNPPALSASATATVGVAILAGNYVAYRAVRLRKDTNGVEVRSAPSGRSIVLGGGTSRTGQILIPISSAQGTETGDVIEVYRTVNNPDTPRPDDELYQVLAHTVTSAELSAGLLTLTDTIEDSYMGAPLYTNSLQEGAVSQHLRRPYCRTLRRFNDSLFLGNLKFKATAGYAVSVARSAFAAAGQVGIRVMTGTFTNGSTSVAVADSSLFKIGQIVAADTGSTDYAGSGFYVRITAIPDSTHVTLSVAWDGSTGSVQRAVLDSIRIGSQYFPAATLRQFVLATRGYDVDDVGQGAGLVFGECTTAQVDAESDMTESSDASIGLARNEFVITALDHSTSVTLYATNGDLYDPPLPEPTATATTIAPETMVNGLMWSNSREPEHFKGQNIARIGSDTDEILAIRTCRRGVIVFKPDGAFIVTGIDETTGFRVDELERAVRLITPQACIELGPVVYAWGDLGVFECDENGCQNVSLGISDLIDFTARYMGIADVLSAAKPCWMISNRKEGEVILALPEVSGAPLSRTALVFNAGTRAWTRWFDGETLLHGTEDEDGVLHLLRGGRLQTERQLEDGAAILNSDLEHSITITAVSETTITFTSSTYGSPAVGDKVLRSGTSYLVTAVVDTTHVTLNAAPSTGAATVYEAFTSTITPIASPGTDPSALKLWGEGSVMWANVQGLRSYTLSFTSSMSSTATEVPRTVSATPMAAGLKPEAYRFTVPRRHGRCTRLYPSLIIRQAGSPWVLEGFTLKYRPASSRVRNT